MTPEELESARREAKEMSDARLANLLDGGPTGMSPDAWEVLLAERVRRSRVPPRLRVSDAALSERTDRSGLAVDERRYPALRIIIVLTKATAVLVLAVFVSVAVVGGLPLSPFLMLEASVLGVVAALGLWAGAEIMQVLIDIEENTRRRP